MPHGNGKIYTQGIYGISWEDIAITLGVTNQDAGYLSSNQHGKTNKKATYKPINVNKIGEVNDVDRKGVNYGHSYGYTFDTLLDLVHTWAEQDVFFPYNPPTQWYRPMDFDGYDNYEGDWFECYVKNPSLSEQSTQKFLVRFNYELLGERINGITAASLNALDFGFIVLTAAPSTSIVDSQIKGYYKVTNIRGTAQTLPDIIQDYDNKIPVTPSVLGVGTYWLIPCFTTMAFATEAGTMISRRDLEDAIQGYGWYLYPFCPAVQLSVTSGGGSQEQQRLEKITIDMAEVETTRRDYLQYRMTLLTFEVHNSDSAAVSLTLNTVTVDNAISGGVVGQNIDVLSIPAGGHKTAIIVQEKEGEGYKDYTLASNDVKQLTVNYSIKNGSADANAILDYDPEK